MEKLYEELIADSDKTLPTRIARVRIARLSQAHVDGELTQWLGAVQDDRHGTREATVTALRRCVAEYGTPEHSAVGAPGLGAKAP